MPRDPSRISPTLRAVERLWLVFPDLRLGQLLCWVARGDPFSIEDAEVRARVEKHLQGMPGASIDAAREPPAPPEAR